MNTWAEVTDTPLTMTELKHTSVPSDHSTTGINITRVLKKQYGIDSSIEYLEASKELIETYNEVPDFGSYYLVLPIL